MIVHGEQRRGDPGLHAEGRGHPRSHTEAQTQPSVSQSSGTALFAKAVTAPSTTKPFPPRSWIRAATRSPKSKCFQGLERTNGYSRGKEGTWSPGPKSSGDLSSSYFLVIGAAGAPWMQVKVHEVLVSAQWPCSGNYLQALTRPGRGGGQAGAGGESCSPGNGSSPPGSGSQRDPPS